MWVLTSLLVPSDPNTPTEDIMTVLCSWRSTAHPVPDRDYADTWSQFRSNTWVRDRSDLFTFLSPLHSNSGNSLTNLRKSLPNFKKPQKLTHRGWEQASSLMTGFLFFLTLPYSRILRLRSIKNAQYTYETIRGE